jgi:hypothetical protein
MNGFCAYCGQPIDCGRLARFQKWRNWFRRLKVHGDMRRSLPFVGHAQEQRGAAASSRASSGCAGCCDVRASSSDVWTSHKMVLMMPAPERRPMDTRLSCGAILRSLSRDLKGPEGGMSIDNTTVGGASVRQSGRLRQRPRALSGGSGRCNPVQGATASLASTATLALWNV